ncbi:MAG: protein translocase subunit SecF [Candidatus Yanofskybacteria bacterium]|nr:protein translocase subunit SecF [Candidatus Yanofskybacteria bacterium]
MIPKIYNFMFWFSIALVLASVISFAVYGLNFGVDFKGGTVIELEFTAGRPEVSAIQDALAIPNAVVNSSGDNGVIIRAGQMTETEHQQLLSRIQDAFPQAGLQENKFDSVGPVIGDELRSKSVRAIILVLLAVTIYMTVVFRRISGTVPSWMMGVAAIVALLHDVVIPTGIFAWLGHYFGVEISAVFVAAVLTILGYSVSDTVVVFDRVRENVIKGGAKEDFGAVVHKSVMQTLTRSINTTLTTLLSLIAIYLFGGESIRYFALALIMGIFFGAYSSIFVASPVFCIVIS